MLPVPPQPLLLLLPLSTAGCRQLGCVAAPACSEAAEQAQPPNSGS